MDRGPVPDRLPPMLFLAALIHGILIIGITFNAVLGSEASDAISLEVTIVADPDQEIDRPEEAEYLAQASQEGGGNTVEQVRPGAPLQSSTPIDNIGTETGDSLTESSRLEEVADQLLTTRTEQRLIVPDEPRDDPSLDESTAIALESGVLQTLPLPREDEANFLIHDQNLRQLVTSVDTKESNVAGYLERWKTKIETIGVKYFPERGAMQGMTGSPTLEVTINASGQLAEVVVRQSSGSKLIDQAALNILRRAAPFDPFPEAIRLDYDQLRFAYKWQFNEIGVSSTARLN
ncbi:MAG: energy transducer TonB [Woeseiaceae bacterium]